MTENMTEPTTNLGRCIMGASTDTPCTRPAVAPLPYELPESILDGVGGVCVVHAAMQPLWDEIDELALALEVLQAWRKAVERRENRHLLRITAQAEADIAERLEFLVGHTEAIKEAEIGQRS